MTIDDSDPIDTSGDALSLTQTCWTQEAADRSNDNNLAFRSGVDSYVNGEALGLGSGDSLIEWSQTANHRIPSDDVGAWFALVDSNNAQECVFYIDVNGTRYNIGSVDGGTGLTPDDTNIYWEDLASGSLIGGTYTGPDIQTGDEVVIGMEATADNGMATLATAVAFRDNRFPVTFDDTVHEPQGHLDGPELYPDSVGVELSTETRRDVTEATAEIDTDSTDANQYIELRIGSDAFDRTNNAASASTTGGPARSIDVTLGLTRYPDDSDPQSATPRYGYNGQSVDSYALRGNPDAINASGVGETEVDAIVGQGEITGDRLEEAAQLTSGGTTLTRSILAPFDVFAETSVRSSEKVEFSNDE